MTTFASIHTDLPKSQCDNEASYKGYHRVALDFHIGNPIVHILFPEVEEDTKLVMTHIAIGSDECDNGKILTAIPCFPHVPLVKMQPGKVPNIALAYPQNLDHSVLVIHQSFLLGKIVPEELSPEVFYKTNLELEAAGIPILKAVRNGAATWDIKMSQMPSLSMM